VSTEAVTVLFTDLVGSTEMSSRLDRDAADELRQAHFGLLRAAIAATGGVEVKNLGDGLMVVFTSPSRALGCAVAMQQAIERHNRRAEWRLGLRVGVSMGEAVEEDGDYFGEPVIEAARLCAVASGGQILATDLMRMMLGRHATHDLVPVGALELKGLPDPVDAVEVRWEADAVDGAAGAGIPLPARLARAAADDVFIFIGRAAEFEQIATAAKRSAGDQQVRVLLVAGEPGVGKTALVAHAARSVHDEGIATIYGACEEELVRPYHPWLSAGAYLIEHASDDTLETLSNLHSAALARVLPSHAERLGAADAVFDAENERVMLMDAFVALLAAATSETALLVVLDDLQWADSASLQLLRHVVASGVGMRVVVVATYRDSDLSRTHPLTPLLADLWREASVARISLAGLADTEILDLLNATAGYEVGDAGAALARMLRQETEGNPFFVVELLRHLGESGELVPDERGRYALRTGIGELALPSSVRDVVARRVARLGDETLQTLSVAAVIGRDFDFASLVDVIRADRDDLLDLLDGAVGASLVSEDRDIAGRYRFVHALIQHTLYEDLSATRRQRWHERVAHVLEAQGADSAVQARHWVAATQPTDTAKALEYAHRAGDDALAALSPDDAVRWYRQALELLDRQRAPDARTRCRLLLDLGSAESLASSAVSSEPFFMEAGRIAREIGDVDLLVRAALGGGQGEGAIEFAVQEKLELLEFALQSVGSGDSPERARLLAALAVEFDPSEWQQRRAYADEAVAIARRISDDESLLAILSHTLFVTAVPDRLEQRRADLVLGIELAERANDIVTLAVLHRVAHETAIARADLATADVHLEAARALTAAGLAQLEWSLRQAECMRMLLHGELADCELATAAALELGTRAGFVGAGATYAAHMLNIRIQQGRVDEFIDLFEPIVAENPNIAVLRSALMMTYCESGRLDDARELFARDVANSFADFPYDATWLSSMSRLTDVTFALRDVTAAAVLLERLSPFVGQVAMTAPVTAGAVDMSVARLLTVLGRDEEADAAFAAAVEIHERLEAPYLIARTQLDWADLLRIRNAADDASRALALIAGAHDSATTYGFAALAQRAAGMR
jgi:class 3 adenylate cyclase/tetratricopeptide (TPR) repeat protein